MAKNKFDFIAELLEKKDLNHSQKERIYKMIAKEIKDVETRNNEILKRLEEIEKKVNKIGEEPVKQAKKLIKRHDPKRVVDVLSLFSKGNSHIKYSTHIWDEKLYNNYDNFIQGINEDFKNFRFFELGGYNSNLYWEKIYPFLFQKNLTELQKSGKSKFGWGKHKIKIGWQYPDLLKEWCKENFDNKNEQYSTPFSLEIPKELIPQKRIEGKTIKYFEDAVNIFKNEIEFRDNRLYLSIKTAIDREIPNFSVDEDSLETLKGKSFFTNTEYVIKAISRMLTEIKARSENINVVINCQYNRLDNSFELNILHKDSFSLKELDHPKITLKEDTGNLSIIRTTLNSLCHFSVESKFLNKNNEKVSAKIDYLYEGVEKKGWIPKINILDIPAEGFKYFLKFPAL